MAECPNCGFSFFYCISCGEPCSDDEDNSNSCKKGHLASEGGVDYICEG